MLAQNFQSDDNFEEAKQHIDAAKVSIFYLGLCMERSAVATQEAFWHVGQCHGDNNFIIQYACFDFK